MLPLLALFAQTATLDADPGKAALACAVAVPVANPDADSMQLTAQLTYFVMQAAKADPGTKAFLQRVEELAGNLDAADGLDTAKARTILSACDARFPLARKAVTVRLPADPLRRDILCLGAVGIVYGAAQGMLEEGGDPSYERDLKPIMDGYVARLTDERLAQNGIDGDAKMDVFLGRELIASLELGNVDRITQACAGVLGN